MTTRLLRKEYRFIGRVMISQEVNSALIILQTDLELHIYMPILGFTEEEMPKVVEGEIEDWNVRAEGIAGKISYWRESFNLVKDKIGFNSFEEKTFLEEVDQKEWRIMTYRPATFSFTKKNIFANIPDEWGITFYPEDNNKRLFHFFENNRNPFLLLDLPDIFPVSDKCLYFKNNEQWTLEDIQNRLKLLTSCLSFFTGSPVSYELLIGRYKKEILCIQFNNESNPNAYICPSPYNGCVDIKREFLKTFSTELIQAVETLFKKPQYEKIIILLSYFKMLYTAYYREAKIAFSFQLMESLARHNKIKFGRSYKNNIVKELSDRVCPSCRELIKQEIRMESDDFIGYISKALNVIKKDKEFKTQPSTIKKIAEKFRHHVFHGSLFDEMTEVEKLVGSLPESYQNNIPVLFQALVSLIGANLILGIDFKRMVAIKRKMH